MEQILESILDEYGKLLDLYEKIYDSFKSADYTKVDEYINTMSKNSEYITSISNIQKKIEVLREGLKEFINNEILIDSVTDGFSDGQISAINDKIKYIIDSLKVYEVKGKSILEEEMIKIEGGLENMGTLDLLV